MLGQKSYPSSWNRVACFAVRMIYLVTLLPCSLGVQHGCVRLRRRGRSPGRRRRDAPRRRLQSRVWHSVENDVRGPQWPLLVPASPSSFPLLLILSPVCDQGCVSFDLALKGCTSPTYRVYRDSLCKQVWRVLQAPRRRRLSRCCQPHGRWQAVQHMGTPRAAGN